MSDLDALELALALYRAPRNADQVRRQPLPRGMTLLLRVAGGDQAALFEAHATGAKPQDIVEAARFFVQQALFWDDRDPYRVLGVRRDADPALIKDHHRFLIRFLHPDRSDGTGMEVYAERINRAWNALRTPERRAETDRRLDQPLAPAGADDDDAGYAEFSTTAPPMPRASVPAEPLVRRPMPHLGVWLMGAALLFAVLTVGWFWLEQRQGPAAADTAVATTLPPAEPVALTSERAVDSGAEASVDISAAGASEPGPDAASVADGAARVADTAPSEAAAEVASEIAADADVIVATSVPAPAAAASPVAAEAAATGASAALGDRAASGDRARPAIARTAPVVPRVAITTAPAPSRVPATVRAAEAQTAVTSPDADPAPTEGTTVAALAEPQIGAPVALTEPNAPQPPIQRRQAEAVLAEFSVAYARGDLEQLLALFSADARNNRGGLTAIAEDYKQFFDGSGWRSIDFADLKLIEDRDRTTATAYFAAQVQPRDKGKMVKVSGRIQFDLRRQADRVLIERLLHEESPRAGML